MSVSIKIEGQSIVNSYLKSLSVETEDKLKRFTLAAGLKIENLAKKKVAVDQGNLRNSIISTALFSKNKMEVEIGPTASYGAHIEYGTKPHRPPVEALMRWAELHGMDRGVAWYIQKQIGKYGSIPRPYLIPAYNKIKPQYVAGVNQIIQGLR